jgi:hypothetical protein
VRLVKPTGGWNANAFVLFDYFGPNDFKFAGLDDSTNKLVAGYRDATGWHVVAQSEIRTGVRYNTWYDMLVAVNGTNVTVLVDGTAYFTYTFEPRVIDDVAYGLNKGLLGFGSDNSRGQFDNIQLQVLPPTLTLDRREDFSDGAPGLFGDTTGDWAVSDGRYQGEATSFDSATARIDLGRPLAYFSYLELETLAASGADWAGLVFDYYSDVDFKYVVVDVANDLVLLGHRTPAGWSVDASTAWALDDGIDHLVKITVKGASVNVLVDGATVFGYGFNSPLVDGGFGVLTTGTGSFDDVRVRTDDPGFDEYDPGTLVSIGDATVTEGDSGSTEVTATISLDAAADEAITVAWVTGPGSALAGADFVAASGTLTFAPGETSKTITVEVLGDLLVEGDETFTLQLGEVTGPATVDDGLGVVTILDDDTPPPLPSVSIGDATVAEGDTGTTAVTLTVTLSEASASEVTVAWATSDGSAAAGSDYTAASGTLTFAPGETSKTITVFVSGDTAVEPNEAFTVTLSSPGGAEIGDGSASVTITNDDAPAGGPTLSIADLSVVEGDKGKGSWVSVTVTLSEAAATDVTVDFTTIDGTATGGSDYESASGTLFIAAGTTTATIRVRVLTDRVNEGDETFSIVLSNAAGASIADGAAVVTIVDDDGALFTASSPETTAAVVEPLSLAEAETMLETATAMWAAAGADVSVLGGVTLAIGDLPAGKLADVDGSTVTLDADAAGWGWFVDDTPWDADEFQTAPDGSLVAGNGSAAAGRIDLLTVLLHELGHLLGFGHDSHGLMAHDLEAGIRLLPWHDRRFRPL